LLFLLLRRFRTCRLFLLSSDLNVFSAIMKIQGAQK
jgi:hypothetical protein